MKIRCRECRGTGVVEYIDVWARHCDACHGDGELDLPIFWALYIRLSNWWARKGRPA